MLFLTASLSLHVPADFNQIGPNELHLMTRGVMRCLRRRCFAALVIYYQMMARPADHDLHLVNHAAQSPRTVSEVCECSQYGVSLLTRSKKQTNKKPVLTCSSLHRGNNVMLVKFFNKKKLHILCIYSAVTQKQTLVNLFSSSQNVAHLTG